MLSYLAMEHPHIPCAMWGYLILLHQGLTLLTWIIRCIHVRSAGATKIYRCWLEIGGRWLDCSSQLFSDDFSESKYLVTSDNGIVCIEIWLVNWQIGSIFPHGAGYFPVKRISSLAGLANSSRTPGPHFLDLEAYYPGFKMVSALGNNHCMLYYPMFSGMAQPSQMQTSFRPA